jgi:hypothetical protein
VTSKVSEGFATVVNLCARQPKRLTVQFSKPETNLADDRVTELTVEGVPVRKDSVSDRVDLLILPKDGSGSAWPSFKDAKQNRALGRHIVVKKQA